MYYINRATVFTSNFIYDVKKLKNSMELLLQGDFLPGTFREMPPNACRA